MGPEAAVLEPAPGELTGSELAAGAGPVIRWLRNGAILAARRLHTAFGPPEGPPPALAPHPAPSNAARMPPAAIAGLTASFIASPARERRSARPLPGRPAVETRSLAARRAGHRSAAPAAGHIPQQCKRRTSIPGKTLRRPA